MMSYTEQIMNGMSKETLQEDLLQWNRVYRRKTMNEPLHSGNMQFGSDYLSDKEEAQRIADQMNATRQAECLFRGGDE